MLHKARDYFTQNCHNIDCLVLQIPTILKLHFFFFFLSTNRSFLHKNYILLQVILPMALSNGTSKVLCGPLTLHTQTAITIVEMLTKVRLKICVFSLGFNHVHNMFPCRLKIKIVCFFVINVKKSETNMT